ncbi:MAG: hypothetical protein ACT4PM_03005 [Gemmatimonadales bacterium]
MSRRASRVLLLLALATCGGNRTIAVQILVPDLNGVETPLPGAVITALPYDRDSVLAAMERRASTPRPHTSALDSLFHAFRGPFTTFALLAWKAGLWRRLRDSLAGERARAASPAGQGEIGAQMRTIETWLRDLEPDMARARTALNAARDTLWPRIEGLKALVERWELSTFAGYDSIVQTLTRDRLRAGLADTTNARGWVHLVLTPGRWWIYARSPDPQDPNAQWYWNLPAEAGLDTLRLSRANARHLPRY